MYSIDLETYSEVDLKKCGIYKYAKHSEILLTAYCDGSGEVQLIDHTIGEQIPEEVKEIIIDDNIKKYAWNATFERLVLSNHFGVELKACGWDCTQFRAANMGLSLTLGVTAKALKTTLKIDTRLINFFCKPNSKGKRNYPKDHPEKWEEFKAYCIGDVISEFEIRELLKDIKIERKLYALDGEINDRGVKVNMDLVNNCIGFDEREKELIIEDLKKITDLPNPNSLAQLKNWLLMQGVNVSSLDKDHVIELLAQDIPPIVREVLELRQNLGRSSTKKFKSIQNAVCGDRVHGLFQCCGATRTRRWAGRIVQPQNLYKNKEKLLTEARDMAIKGVDPRLLFDDDILSQLIRTSFEGPFSIADFSAIEARVLAWMAKEKWVSEIFAGDGKIYEAQAARMYNVPITEVTKELRQKGKIATLALGYQGSLGALRAMGYEGEDDDLMEIVGKYRQSNPHIVQFWYSIDDAVREVIEHGSIVRINGLKFERDERWLYIYLPSGNRLCYFNPRIDDEGIKYAGTYSGAWVEDLETYGGKVVENCLASETKVLTSNGWKNINIVLDTDLLWDGANWVKHDGLTEVKSKDTIKLNGVRMTNNHKIKTTKGWRYASQSEGYIWATVQLPNGFEVSRKRWEKIVMAVPMSMWKISNKSRNGIKKIKDKIMRLYAKQHKELYPPNVETSRLLGVAEYERKVFESEAPGIQKLWGERDKSVFRMGRKFSEFLERYGRRISKRVNIRQDKQRSGVLQRKLSMVDIENTSAKYKKKQKNRYTLGENNDIRSRGNFGCGSNDTSLSNKKQDTKRKIILESGLYESVYDLKNTGPNNCFTIMTNIGPAIVHNCIQSIARDCLAITLMRCQHLPIVMHVHDEIIVEGDYLQEMLEIMERPISWAPGLLLTGDGFMSNYYRKE